MSVFYNSMNNNLFLGGISITRSLICSEHSSTSATQLSSSATCVMKYGMADGPVTAGVLSGKCPSFDVWGSTVNLAARMKVCLV